MTTLPVAQAFAVAFEVARSMPRWIIVASDAGAGWIEASQQSRWFRFTDDIVIRVASDDLSHLTASNSTISFVIVPEPARWPVKGA